MSQLSNSDYAALVEELVWERDQLASRLEEQRDALEATTAYVELFTKDGVRKQPPAWAIGHDGDFDAQVMADRARSVLAKPSSMSSIA
nr:hypothetical protein [uncultured Comamonas sp.]